MKLLNTKYVMLIGGMKMKNRRQSFIIIVPNSAFNTMTTNVSNVIESVPYINALISLLYSFPKTIFQHLSSLKSSLKKILTAMRSALFSIF